MLPKVATTILHSTSRAAAAVQGQSHTIRNVLQLQSSSPSSSSKSSSPGSNYFNSNWNGGPSSGGRGGRFTHGYLGASRAVTQAEPAVASDTGYVQSDEPEEIVVTTRRVSIHPHRRLRSQSLSYNPQERAQKLGVLSTVQNFARSRHAFAQPLSTEDLSTEVAEHPPSPVLTRRNSTASATWNESAVDINDLPPPLQSSPPRVEIDYTYPKPPSMEVSLGDPRAEESSEFYQRLMTVRSSGDNEAAIRVVNELRAAELGSSFQPSIREYNLALETLYVTRRPGQPLTMSLEIYNHLINSGLNSNYRTYIALIQALCDRDHEVIWALTGLENKEKWRKNTMLSVEKYGPARYDMEQRKSLEAENNFTSAIALFQALVSLNSAEFIPFSVFTRLLRSCAHYGNIDAAILIWESIEKRSNVKPSAVMYKYMIQTFARAGEASAAEDVFNHFRETCSNGSVEWSTHDGDMIGPSRALMMTWNHMIEAYFKVGMPDKAVALVEEMLKARDDGSESTIDQIPSPSPATFTTVIAGFCHSGDLQTALAWFERLLHQPSPSAHPFDSTPVPTRPDVLAWRVLFETFVAKPEMLDQLNALWVKFLDIGVNDGIQVRTVDRLLVLKANLDHITSIQAASNGQKLSDQNRKEILDTLAFVEQHVAELGIPGLIEKHLYIIKQYFDIGLFTPGLEFGLRCAESVRADNSSNVNNFIHNFGALVLDRVLAGEHMALPQALRLNALWRGDDIEDNNHGKMLLLHTYAHARRQGLPELSETEWKTILSAAATMEVLPPTGGQFFSTYAFDGIVPFLKDMVIALPNLRLDTLDSDLRTAVFRAVLWQRSFNEVKDLFAELQITEAFAQLLDEVDSSSNSDAASTWSQAPEVAREHFRRYDSRYDSPTFSTAPTSPAMPVDVSMPEVPYEGRDIPQSSAFMDRTLTRQMEDALTKRVLPSSNVGPVIGIVWDMFERGLKQHKLPAPYTLARLCQALGRAKETDKVKEVYKASQILLANMENDKKLQSDSWFIIEDGMIIAFAQAGEIDAAHVHRMRILAQGGSPSADAYGGLILHVKDTTDDTSNAMALFQEAVARGVNPNQYLYNNIISKLAKARKADAALELFSQMKESGIAASSITYGAVIGACARVGDVASAEVLFTEMARAKSFKPRIPPFNTMMQLYTTTKPNRERALFFYNELLNAGVRPTEYTYKLLMEAYVIEPINITKVEQVFQELCHSPNLQVQGTHFATLINAYGCVAKDLDKALAVYASIATHPRRPRVDALIYEALTNVFVAHRRMDLVPEYMSQMSAAGVHMTAYIVNLLIKGYAAVGNIDTARDLFESLVDPPEGIAALHNHAPHEPSKSPVIDPMEPVYREPSTWEAMVRAELGGGHRDRAVALLERLRTRQYPDAVFNRISGIMVDHSQILP